MKRVNIASSAPWESVAGYSRAVRVGDHVWISGTTAINRAGILVGENNAYEQTVQILANIAAALNDAGVAMHDVVRTRMYVVNIEDNWRDVARAHREAFEGIMPATTMVEVSSLIDTNMLVEIEADARVLR